MQINKLPQVYCMRCDEYTDNVFENARSKDFNITIEVSCEFCENLKLKTKGWYNTEDIVMANLNNKENFD